MADLAVMKKKLAGLNGFSFFFQNAVSYIKLIKTYKKDGTVQLDPQIPISVSPKCQLRVLTVYFSVIIIESIGLTDWLDRQISTYISLCWGIC